MFDEPTERADASAKGPISAKLARLLAAHDREVGEWIEPGKKAGSRAETAALTTHRQGDGVGEHP